MLLTAASMFGMFFFVTQYLQLVLGYSPLRTGFAFLPFAVLIFAGARIAPRLVPRFGTRYFLIGGPLCILAGLLLLTRIGAATPYAPGVLVPMVLFGMGAGFTMVPLSLTILAGVRPAESGAASGTLQTMQQVGGALGTAVLLTVFSSATRHPAPGESAHALFAHGVSSAMGVGSVLIATALTVIVTLVRPPRGPARAR